MDKMMTSTRVFLSIGCFDDGNDPDEGDPPKNKRQHHKVLFAGVFIEPVFCIF